MFVSRLLVSVGYKWEDNRRETERDAMAEKKDRFGIWPFILGGMIISVAVTLFIIIRLEDSGAGQQAGSEL